MVSHLWVKAISGRPLGDPPVEKPLSPPGMLCLASLGRALALLRGLPAVPVLPLRLPEMGAAEVVGSGTVGGARPAEVGAPTHGKGSFRLLQSAPVGSFFARSSTVAQKHPKRKRTLPFHRVERLEWQAPPPGAEWTPYGLGPWSSR